MCRQFEVVSFFDKSDVELPKRSTKGSAGYDISCLKDYKIPPHKVVIVDTGIKVKMNTGEVFQIYPRSSIGIKKNIMLANTVPIIDQDYYNNTSNEGHVLVALYNYGDIDQEIKKGDKIAQGIFSSYHLTDDDVTEEIRTGGIGSTGV